MCLQTISSSVLSSDGHLKPAFVCKLHIILKIVITRLTGLQVVLTVGMNHISQHLNEYIL